MYGIFTFSFTSKRRAFDGAEFDSIDAVEAYVSDIAVVFERDEPNDAADFFTKGGEVFAVERLPNPSREPNSTRNHSNVHQ